jgi:hypothetical protein
MVYRVFDAILDYAKANVIDALCLGYSDKLKGIEQHENVLRVMLIGPA